MGKPGVFAACVAMMSMQPLLINLAASRADEHRLPADSFMLAVETLKALLCVSALACRWACGQEAALWRGFRHSAAFAVPACLYLLMNTLKISAARALAPPLFQLLASTKVIATAVSSWLLLGRSLTALQWAAMVLLTVGVALGQHRDSSGTAGSLSLADLEVPLVPVLIMLANSCLSALAAVYTEKVLKAQQSASLSIFATNLHMALHTLLVNLAKASVCEAPVLTHPGSIGWRTWAALGNEAVNGILVSTLMRHADSIVKNYAFSASIFATALISVPVLGYWPQWPFLLGSLLVLCSMAMYSREGRSHSPKKLA
mmetsp:Transcript_64205/g.187868  ORF Transcript_64205/g.187868 Transcript_64205/m.187868 type:complete len:316 (-) Transcript_64205:162-1109(-)